MWKEKNLLMDEKAWAKFVKSIESIVRRSIEEKAYIKYKQDDMWTLDSFKKAIEDNLPPQIPVEAVEQLREKYIYRIKELKDISIMY